MREGWVEKKLGNLCVVLDSQRKPVAKINRKKGIFPYYGANGLLDYVDDYIFEGKYVLLGEDGANWDSNASSSYIVDGKIWVNNHAHVIKVNNLLNDEYLVYYLNYKDLNKYISGAIIKKLTQSSLKEINIEYPDLSFQEKIVSELDKISEMISKYDEQLKELDKLSQSIFYEMFGDPIENEKGWEMSTIEMTCIIKSGNSEANYSKEGTLPYIKVSDMNLPLNSKYINTYSLSVDFEQNKKNIIPIGATIFPKRGGAIFTNKKRITNKEICCDLNIMAVIPGIRIQQEYLYMYFMFIDFSKLPNGSSVPQINNKDIGPLKIALPPLPLQQSFARKIEAIEAMKSKVREAKKEAETLLAARMQYWFE